MKFYVQKNENIINDGEILKTHKVEVENES